MPVLHSVRVPRAESRHGLAPHGLPPQHPWWPSRASLSALSIRMLCVLRFHRPFQKIGIGVRIPLCGIGSWTRRIGCSCSEPSPPLPPPHRDVRRCASPQRPPAERVPPTPTSASVSVLLGLRLMASASAAGRLSSAPAAGPASSGADQAASCRTGRPTVENLRQAYRTGLLSAPVRRATDIPSASGSCPRGEEWRASFPAALGRAAIRPRARPPSGT